MLNQTIHFNQSGQIILTLPESKYRKRLSIGFIKDGSLIIQKQRARHFLRLYNGYSFNYDLIAYHSDKFSTIDLIIDGTHFYTTPSVVMARGKMLHFDEMQICINEKYLCKSKGEALQQCGELEKEQAIDFKPRIADIQPSLFAEAV